jgi:hypothetical protein
VPVQVMPREILAAHQLLAEVEQGLGRVADKPALIVWGDKDPGFREPTVGGGSAPSPTTGPTSSAEPRTISRKTRPRRSSPRSSLVGRARPRADSQPMRLRHHGCGQLTAAEVTCPLPPAAHHPGRLHGGGPGRTRRPGAPTDRRAPPPPGPLSHQRTARLAAHTRSGVAIDGPLALVLLWPEEPSRKVRKLSSCRLRRWWPFVLLSAGLSISGGRDRARTCDLVVVRDGIRVAG